MGPFKTKPQHYIASMQETTTIKEDEHATEYIY